MEKIQIFHKYKIIKTIHTMTFYFILYYNILYYHKITCYHYERNTSPKRLSIGFT